MTREVLSTFCIKMCSISLTLISQESTIMLLSKFTGDKVEADVELGMYANVLKTKMEFVLMNISYVHNAILGH